MPENPSLLWAADAIKNAVQWLRLLVETCGALVIAAGLLVVIFSLARMLAARRHTDFNAVRITFARYLALALEFQLAADILSTAIAPGWDEISKLAAIAIIRTALNFFLMREMQQEQSAAPAPGEVAAAT